MNVESNRITRLPDSMRSLENLFELTLRGNRVTDVAMLGDCKRLSYLDVRANGMTTLSDRLADLPLEKLDLRWNPISTYPAWLDDLEAKGCTVFR
jgi:Leucine-rich repeat (LRR) protein